MGDRVVDHYLVAGWQDEHLLLLIHLLPLCYQHLDVRQRLRHRQLPSLVAEVGASEAILDGLGGLEGDPLGRGLGNELDVVEGRPVFLAVGHLEVDPRGEGDRLGAGLWLLGHFGEEFNAGDPFLL